MPSADLSRRVKRVVNYPPLVDTDAEQRRELQEALYDARSFDELPGKWQAAILEAEEKVPTLRPVPDR